MLKFIDTSRDFWKERRAVWMSPPDGAEAPAAPETDVAPVEEESKPDLLEAKKTVFAAKVDGAKTMLEDLHKLYGLNEQGVDTNTSNDQAVNQLYDQLKPQLDGLVGRFETESAALTGATEQQLADLDAKLVTEVLDLTAGGNATELQAGIKEDVAGKAGVDTEKVDADLAKLKDAREKDKAAYDSANGKVAEFEKFITDFKEVYPSKNTAELTALVDGFKSVGEYAEGAGADVNPEILNTELAALEKSFAEKAATIAGTGYETAKMNVQEALSKLDASVPEESRRFAEGLLGNKNGPVTLDGGKVLGPEKMTEYGISDASGYQIASRLEQNDASGEAYLVMNYENAVLKQEFTDEAAFKKKYPEIKLPEKGGTSTANEVRFLSPAKPAPFGGVRRQRALEISVAQDGKISVKISNIMFGDPPKSEVHVPLRKHINDVKKVEDILYPSGYTREEGSNGTESDGSERGAEAGEELKSLEEYERTLQDLAVGVAKLPEINPNDPRFANVPKFLIHVATVSRETVNGSLAAVANMLKQAESSPEDTEKLQDVARQVNVIERQFSQASADWAIREFEKMQRDGLKYGPPNGREASMFSQHFSDANSTLTDRFDDAQVSGAKIDFKGSGNSKYISGHFKLEVKGFDAAEPVKFSFRDIGPMDNWEELVNIAMQKLTDNKDVRKGLKEQRREKNDIVSRISFINDKEAGELGKRQKAMDKKGKDYDPLRYPDYEGKNAEEVAAKIKADFGNPAEYLLQLDHDGDEVVAVRQAPRGASVIPSGEFGIAAGLVERITPQEQAQAAFDSLPEASLPEDGETPPARLEEDYTAPDEPEEESPPKAVDVAPPVVTAERQAVLTRNEADQVEMAKAIETFSLEEEDDEQISEPANPEPIVPVQPTEVPIQESARPVAAEQSVAREDVAVTDGSADDNTTSATDHAESTSVSLERTESAPTLPLDTVAPEEQPLATEIAAPSVSTLNLDIPSENTFDASDEEGDFVFEDEGKTKEADPTAPKKPESVLGDVVLESTPAGETFIDLSETTLEAGTDKELSVRFHRVETPSGYRPDGLMINRDGELMNNTDSVDNNVVDSILSSDWQSNVPESNRQEVQDLAKLLYVYESTKPAVENVRATVQAEGSGYYQGYDYGDYSKFLDEKISDLKAKITTLAQGRNIFATQAATTA
ncbi:hypothetical protein A2344_00735 [Candidatus Peregrinibacteria bacterium RIFOXYB12_FULL_41_12]|nr:MAG: hypothetical protein A2244_01490 [Candidatus Peregrinibacteria bacterium RIFOXYA2_FULL_41_18]OGJ49044.1 MAG: hypothetical protein A2344_00735 [Candidatus Peregrinibacteria bacterium RIFOXYB12_FULL_41_12]OGJ54319.1 MAG: hypothetical protein A2336_00315 [Candidatus Peregrinibacteria bacterium RIFOXYB2_FULL_41_88]